MRSVPSAKVTFREIIRLVEIDGWRLVAQRGHYHQLEHPSKRGRVTIAGRPADLLPPGTAVNILRPAALGGPRR